MAGRNALLHNGGPTVVGTSGHSTTKPGRFLFSVPSPYVSHDPRDGLPAWLNPVFIISIDGSWFGMSVYIDRIQQMSSAIWPTLGNSSLTSMPHCPYFLNWNGERSREPVLRSVRMAPLGRGWPWYLSSIGLGSKLSTCERPPFMNRKMMCLARASWCRPPLAKVPAPLCCCARAIDSLTSPANAVMPKPPPMRQSASRRVNGRVGLCDLI